MLGNGKILAPDCFLFHHPCYCKRTAAFGHNGCCGGCDV